MPTPQRTVATLLLCLLPMSLVAQDTLDSIETEGLERISEGQQSQQKITSVSERNRELLDEFRAELKLVEGLETYITLLDRQLEGQRDEIDLLQNSIANVAVIERQILPLMVRMVDSLEQFIDLDLPFLQAERRDRVAKLRGLMQRSDVTVAEKARRVFEGFQIESDYGRTIEAYKDKLQLAGGSFDADFLRVGRVGLMYRTVGADNIGYWDSDSGGWQELDSVPYRRLINKGLRVARQEVAPELLFIPVDPSGVQAQ